MRSSPAVLVTRPAGQADVLLAALERSGLRGIHQPMMTLQALPELPPEQRQSLLDLDLYQHVIFISANAVQFGMARIDDYWPQLPTGVNWYAIGASTAALLSARGLDPRMPARRMDSEGLLELEGLADVAGQNVLIVKGQGGRHTLRDVLTARGAKVDELACYRRRCPELLAGALPALLESEQVEAILVSSGEGLSNMLTLLSDPENTKFRDTSLIVPSPRVAGMAQQSGFTDITTAANASDDAMLAALLKSRGGE